MPSVTRVFRKDEDMFVYLEAYQPRAVHLPGQRGRSGRAADGYLAVADGVVAVRRKRLANQSGPKLPVAMRTGTWSTGGDSVVAGTERAVGGSPQVGHAAVNVIKNT